MKHLVPVFLLAVLALLPGCEEEEEQGCAEPPQCPGGVLDENTSLCWQEPRAEGKLSWTEARDYCDELVLAGHDDWHLPGHGDFLSLFDNCHHHVIDGGAGTCSTCRESNACGALFCSDDWGAFWAVCSNQSGGCLVVFHSGVFTWDNISETYDVRCVRLNE